MVKVRLDRGREFFGELVAYFESIGVRIRRISTKHSRAQGQVERFNGVLESLLRKVTS
jgi:hypothetical protein